MSRIRLLKASPVYSGYLGALYARTPGLANAPYADQYAAVMGACFGWSDFWKTHLEATGTFDVVEVITNALPLQHAWAREHGVPVTGRDWIRDIVRAQVLHHRPDIFFAHDYVHLDRPLTLSLKRDLPHLKLVAYDGIALCDRERFAGYDLVLGCLKSICDTYRAAGINSHLYRLGFETSLRQRIPDLERTHPVSFVGGISLSPRGHQSRSAALDYVSRRLPVSLFLQLPSRAARWGAIPWDLGHGRVVRALTETPRQLLQVRRLHRRNLGPRFGLEMYEILARSRITLNFHIDAAGSQAGNMRLFEATGMGACLVTDDKENLASLFDVGGEIVAFRTWDDCVEKVRYLLDNDAARERIARAGQRRTLQEHTFESQVRTAAEPLRALVAR